MIGLGAGGVVHGWVAGLDPQRHAEALVLLDEIEGTRSKLYVRELLSTACGLSCWTYRYLRPTAGMADLGGTWP